MGAVEPIDVKETEELRDELGALSDTDKHRLRMIAKKYAAVAGDIEPEDLLHEVMMKALEDNQKDRRRCPRGVELLTFLGNAMKSLADNRVQWRERRKEALALETTHADYDLLTESRSDPETKNPEEEIIHAEHEAAFQDFIIEQCQGCEKTQLVLLGGFEGLRGQKLCEFADVNKKELATILRRISRMMDRYRKQRSES